jgi:hypothetical protein
MPSRSLVPNKGSHHLPNSLTANLWLYCLLPFLSTWQSWILKCAKQNSLGMGALRGICQRSADGHRADSHAFRRSGDFRRRLWQVRPRLDVTSPARAGPARTSSLRPCRSHGSRAARPLMAIR